MQFADRIVGAALGQAVADAVGFQVERQDPGVTVPFGEAWLRDGNGPERLRDGHRLGQVSDDTQCARATMEAVAAGGYDPSRIAAGLARIRDDMVGPGRTVSGALRYLAARDPGFSDLDATLVRRKAEGGSMAPTNGALMRIWPVAAIPGTGLAERASACARLTHDHPEAVGAAVAVAAAMRAVLEGTGPEAVLDAVAEGCGGDGEALAVVATTRLWLGLSLRDARAAAWEASRREEKWRFVSPRALPTAAWALRSFVLGEGDFGRAVLGALEGGGDVDTTASVAGSLAGAFRGADGVPPALAARIRDRDRWGAEGHVALARRFAEACAGA